MANETFKDYDGNKKYRKSTGAGSSGDPAVTHVIVDSNALPSGAATSAKQDTIIGHIDSVENLLSSMDGSLGSIDTNFPAAATLADNTANPSTTGVAGYTMVFDGSTWDRWQGAVTVSGVATAANQTTIIGHVDGIETLLTTISGNVDGLETAFGVANGKLTDIDAGIGGLDTLLTGMDADTDAIKTAIQIIDDWDNAASDGASVSGDVAHDTADAGEPVKIGGKATASLSGATNVAAGDRANIPVGIDGAPIFRPHTCLEDIVSGNASNTDGTSTECIAAGAAGVKHYLTSIILTNTSATDSYVEIKDGSTAKLTIPVPAHGGAVLNLPVPVGGTAATAWNFDPGTAMTTIYCSMVAFKSKI